MISLLHKYDCPGLEAKAIEAITHCLACHLDAQNPLCNINTFSTEHYDPITAIYGGVYPEEFYKASAQAWEASRRDGEPNEKLIAVVEATPALAVFLANFFCDTVLRVEQVARWAIENAERGEESLEKVTSSILKVEEAVEKAKLQAKEMKHDVNNITNAMYN